MIFIEVIAKNFFSMFDLGANNAPKKSNTFIYLPAENDSAADQHAFFLLALVYMID